MSLWTTLNFCKLYRFGKSLPSNMAALWAWKLISYSTQSQYLKTTAKFDLIQNKLKPASLGTDWIENERIGLIFAKTIIFAPKTGSINSGTVPEFIYRSFSAWKQAKYARFWKRSFSPRDKRRSETWVVFGSVLACFRPHQTNTLVLEEKMKTTLPDCFQWKQAYSRQHNSVK
jgi:hypothetical protein